MTYRIMNISGNIGTVFFKLDTRTELNKKKYFGTVGLKDEIIIQAYPLYRTTSRHGFLAEQCQT